LQTGGGTLDVVHLSDLDTFRKTDHNNYPFSQAPPRAPHQNMQQTSLQAFEQVQEHLGENQNAVYDVIRRIGPCSNKDIALFLQWPINCVTPRTLELRKLGLVFDVGIGVQCGKMVHFWGVEK